MANKQIKDFTLKTIPDNEDKLLIQDESNITKYITVGSLHQLKAGFFDYNDAATALTPITHDGSEGFKKLTNDTNGPFTNIDYVPTGMTLLWNPSTNQFNWSELSAGDMVDMRVDIDVTTTTPNQEVIVRIQLGIGGTTYTLELDRDLFKAAGTYKMVSYTGGYMDADNTLNNPAELQIDTDAVATIIVNGWYLKVTKR